jgi:hypothetical protein
LFLQNQEKMLKNYYLVEDSTMPSENVMAGPFHADDLEQCALLCERHNAVAAAKNHGALGPSWEHCNAFVYDRQQKRCTLKNKRMGNFYPFLGTGAVGGPNGGHGPQGPRYVSGYRWESLINEINTPFPNMTSGMQNWVAQPQWSMDTLQSNQTGTCPSRVVMADAEGYGVAKIAYDVRPGAIISPHNTTTGPFANGALIPTTRVASMQECANLAASRSGGTSGVNGGINAWTFYPDYTTDAMMSGEWGGRCSLANVREPFYQTTTNAENGAISGFAQTSLSREIKRYLFG